MMRSGMLWLSAGAGLGLAAVAVAFGTAGSPDAVQGRAVAPPASAAIAAVRQQQAAERVRQAAGLVRREPRPDRRARPLLRAGQRLRVLHDAERRRAVARRSSGRPRPQRPRPSSRARAAVRRRNPQRRAAGRGRARRRGQRPARQRPGQWHTGIAQYRDVVYRDLWPGIDLRLRERVGRPEVRVPRASRRAPSGHPARLRRRRRPCARRRPAHCRSRRPLGVLRDSRAGLLPGRSPACACPSRAATCWRPARRRRRGSRSRSAATSRDHELIIDPGVQYTTFLGGSSHETGAGIAVDAAGNAYVAGTTQSPDFPTTAGAFRRTGAAQQLRRRLRHQAEPGRHGARLLDVRRRQRPRLRATASRSTRPATPTSRARRSPRTSRPPAAPSTGASTSRRTARAARTDNTDGFVFKLNAAGSALVYSTYLGGTDIDDAARHRGGRRRATPTSPARRCRATSRRPPARSAARSAAQYDMFVTKLNPAGSALAYSTFLGGTQVDNGERDRGRRRRQRLRPGLLQLDRLPDDARRVRHDRERRLRRHADEAEPGRLGARLLHLPRRQRLRQRRRPRRRRRRQRLRQPAAPARRTSRPPPGAFDTTSDGSDAFVTKLNAAGSALRCTRPFVGGIGERLGQRRSSSTRPGNAWLDGRHELGRLPGHRRRAPTRRSTAAARRLHRRAERRPARRCCTRPTSAARSPRAAHDIARDPTGDVYVTGHTYSHGLPGHGRRLRHGLQRRPRRSSGATPS